MIQLVGRPNPWSGGEYPPEPRARAQGVGDAGVRVPDPAHLEGDEAEGVHLRRSVQRALRGEDELRGQAHVRATVLRQPGNLNRSCELIVIWTI